ncbi:MAG: hypothetical protein WA110_03885 [Anaerolineaceae bacterium]
MQSRKGGTLSTQSQWSDLEAPFVSGYSNLQTDLPLDRFMPPYYPDMATNWVQTYAPPGSWILDPFGNNPYVALELARAGYRVLVTANNPIPAFILEILASAPSAQEWGDALQALSDQRMSDGQRLEDYISAFYRIPCPNCGQPVEVSSFIWNENLPEPTAMTLECAHCGLAGEQPASTALLKQFKPLPSYALHRARALELAAGLNDPLRPIMEEVVKYYSPRALILLQTVLNKINNPDFGQRQKNLLQAMLLTTADQVNQLWAYPLGKNRPRQLIRPPSYQELNLWQALLRSKNTWQLSAQPVVLKYWPDLPSQKGGLSLFKGRLRELAPLPDPKLFSLVYSSLPRRNQAYWNLSGLWSGWLWGQEALAPLRHSLLRQRYDWTWHALSLEKVLTQVERMVLPQTPALIQISEVDTLFLMAGILGAQGSGLRLHAFALDGEETTLQSVWKADDDPVNPAAAGNLLSNARESAHSYLAQRGEPASYLAVITHILLSLHHLGLLKGQPQMQPNHTLNELEDELEGVFRDSATFVRFTPGISMDTGLYWLKKPPASYTPLADQVESVVLEVLHQQAFCPCDEITRVVHQKCRGVMTPEPELITACMNAYADQIQDDTCFWSVRQREDPAARAKDLAQMRALIERLAISLQYTHKISEDGVFWLDEAGSRIYSFFPIITARITPILLKHANSPGLNLVLIPGSRSNLVTYKLKRDPNLQLLWGENWRFVKFRHIRNISANPLLNRELFLSQIYEDAPEYQSSQLALF